jgi:hypothetical protein
MAQGFLAPTKTGSFGESLGNVAGQVLPAVQAEEKRTMDMAKMRMELAQQGLQTTIQGQNAQQDQELFARMAGIPPKTAQAPATPAPVQGGAPIPPSGGAVALPSAPPPAAPPAPSAPAAPPAPPAGALAQAAPPPLSAAPPSPLAQAAPQPAPQAPAGQQLFPAQPSTWTEEETAYAMAQRRSGKPVGEILKEIEENRRKNKVVTTSGTTDVKSGMFYGQYDPTPTETYIHGYGSVKIPASDAKKLGMAKNADEYAVIARQIMKGYETKTPPASPNSTPTGSAPATAPAQRPTTAQADADAAALKTEKEGDAKARAKRTELAIDKLDPAIEVRSIAETAKNLAGQEGAEKVFGLFEKPTIRAALAKMVDEGSFTPIGFRDAMVALNVRFDTPQKPNEKGEDYDRRKQDILDRYYQMGTQAARAKFEASVLAKGQGAFSDGERRMFADTTIGTKMSVSSINKTSDMLIARANFAESVANKILDNEMSYDKFRRTPEYKNMLKAYETRLQSIWSGKAPQRSGGARPDLDAAQANIERQLR